MPWKSSSQMDERKAFIAEYEKREMPFSRLCREFEISRKTGYKILNRYRKNGENGLGDLSRRPRSHPSSTSGEIAELICAMRREHPIEGAVTLLERLHRKHPDLKLPSAVTAHGILRRNGLVCARKTRRRIPGGDRGSLTNPEESNHVLSIDFKGDFLLGNGERCYPLTITDNYSRFVLRCVGMSAGRRGFEEVKGIMTACFLENGLPAIIRSDNGAPFSANGLFGWSKLSVWWMRLGIRPELIEPGCPQQNGRHERMHRTLKASVCKPPGYDLASQQKRFDDFVWDYNYERPHHGLDMRSPAELYVPSAREMPLILKPMEYHSRMLVRKVKENGHIKLDGRDIWVGLMLGGEHLGLVFEDNDRTVTLHFGEIPIGTIDLLADVWKFTPGTGGLG